MTRIDRFPVERSVRLQADHDRDRLTQESEQVRSTHGPAEAGHYVRIHSPLAGTRGQLMDHIALGVTNLDAWIAKLRRENVRFLQQPHTLSDTRAVMIEEPGREALELVEQKSTTR